jgi:2-amino-4-hydroxy-6-hydroxymethyldihydropteridine diphosphokinase
MVVKVRTALEPLDFLRRCQRIEAAADRQRDIHWGPRTLDIDVLFFDDLSISSPELTVPHPFVFQRRFVLAPLSDVAPERCPPDWETTLPPSDVTPRGALDV